MTGLSIEITCLLPEWARWLAQDEDGLWYVFEDKPIFDGECWIVAGFDHLDVKKVCAGIPPKDASTQLYRISEAA